MGDNVKIMRKKGISEKERTSHWLKTIETVKRIDKKLGQNYYYLVSDNSKGYLRHELLKVQNNLPKINSSKKSSYEDFECFCCFCALIAI